MEGFKKIKHMLFGALVGAVPMAAQAEEAPRQERHVAPAHMLIPNEGIEAQEGERMTEPLAMEPTLGRTQEAALPIQKPHSVDTSPIPDRLLEDEPLMFNTPVRGLEAGIDEGGDARIRYTARN